LRDIRAAHRANDAAYKVTSRVMGQANHATQSDGIARKRLMRSTHRACVLGLVAVVLASGAYAAQAAFGIDPGMEETVRTADVVQRVGTKGASADQKSRPIYVWAAIRNNSGVKLRGAIPSEEDRQTMLGMAKAHFPNLSIEQNLKIVEGGPPRDEWLGAVSFALKQLSHLKRGAVRLSNANLKVTGEATSAEDYTEVKRALAGSLPTGISLSGEDVRAPVVDPFVFRADLGRNALSLTGSVPSEDSRKEVHELSRQLFARPGLDDRLEVASGAPKDWDEAVSAALRALSRLESGRVAMSGLAVSIEGVAPDQVTAVDVSYKLRRDLPKIFSTSESIKWKEAKASQDMATEVIPRIKAFARTRGSLTNGELPPLAPLPETR
jgi:hypothetical protein